MTVGKYQKRRKWHEVMIVCLYTHWLTFIVHETMILEIWHVTPWPLSKTLKISKGVVIWLVDTLPVARALETTIINSGKTSGGDDGNTITCHNSPHHLKDEARRDEEVNASA